MERKGERQPERKWEFQMLRFYSFPALFGGKNSVFIGISRRLNIMFSMLLLQNLPQCKELPLKISLNHNIGSSVNILNKNAFMSLAVAAFVFLSKSNLNFGRDLGNICHKLLGRCYFLFFICSQTFLNTLGTQLTSRLPPQS